MTTVERQESAPRFQNYFEVKSVEEGLYRILKDYADEKLTVNDLTEMSDIWLNYFPPVEFFAHRSGTTLTRDNVRRVMEVTKSPEEFAQTDLFREIMSDQLVVNRFQKASAHWGINGYPDFWPNEYRKQAVKPQEATGWRAALKKLFRLKR